MMLLFADTFYFLAILNPHDSAHQAACEHTLKFPGRPFTTMWVLVELLDAMSHPRNRVVVVDFLRDMFEQENIEIEQYSEDVHSKAFELFADRQDKSWSFTDCVSFVVMEHHGIREVLTGDHHFEQAGFVALLK